LDQNEKDVVLNARLTTLGELLAEGVISVRKGNEVGSEAYGTGEVPFVRTSDIANFEISTDPTKAVSEDIYLRYKKAQGLRTGDILMVVDGRYRIGATAILEEHNSRCVVQSHLRIISVRRHDLLDPYELLFALNLPSVRLKIRSLVFIQSTLGTLGSRLLELQIPLLHGDGPWRNRLDRFRETLRSRAEMLSTLKSMTAPEVEL
jgi:type I restriction enzyme M protein